MAQPKPSSGGWRTCGCVAIALVLIALVIAAGGAIWYFFLRAPDIAQGPIVHISSPTTGSIAELNQPIQVTATAEDTAGVMRVELYADGALVAVQETTLAQGSNPLVFTRNWTPLTKDMHILLARAYNRTGKFADSNVVRLDVVEPFTQTQRVNLDEIPRGANVPIPSLSQVSQLSGVSVERLREANPGLRNTDPNVPLPSGTDLNVPRSPGDTPRGSGTSSDSSSPPRPLPGTPAAPTNLTGTGDCASVLLTWVDSPEEESYVLYRIAPGGERTSRVLPRNTTSFRDTLPMPGVYIYQVAAVRGTLEGFGNMFTHNPTCASPAPPPDTMDLLVTFLSIETQTPNNAAWCYVSVNGSPHERVPYEELVLSPDSRNPLRFSWWQIATRGMMLLPRHPVNSPVTLNGIECIGQRRSGGATFASSLGVVNASHPRADWNGAERVANSTNSSTGESFRLRYRIGPDTPEARRQAPDEVRLVGTWVPFTPLIPAPINIRYNPNGREACDQIPPSQNWLGLDAERMACQLIGRPTITWEWRGTPSAIAGFSVMIDYFAMVPRTDPAGRAVLVPRDELARVSQSHCGEQLQFRVAPFLTSGLQPTDGQGTIQLAPCPAPTAPATLIEVTFNELEVGGSRAHGGMIEDNDTCIFCVDREMELFGDLGIIAGTSRLQTTDTRYWHGGRTGSTFSVCGDEATCISQQGVYPWARFALANTPNGRGTLNNNTLRALITEGATLTVWVTLRDEHTGFHELGTLSRGDPYCIDRIEFPARSAREWATLDEIRTITQDHGEASCRITFRVRGRAP